jgi:molybdenum cofactor cytidylyltransferase
METILLAAGLSKRMGRQKLLLPFAGSTVMGTVLGNILKSGLTPVNAVVSKDILSTLRSSDQLRIEINDEPERGQASSFAIGLSMLADGSDFCVMLGDQPLVTPQEMRDFAEKFYSMPEGKTVLVPTHGETLGHPMFYKALWKMRFAGSKGDRGDKKVLFTYKDEILYADAPDSFFCDLDTPSDYKKIINAN